MAERLTLDATPREVTGKQVRQLRREGFIPAIIYGQSEPAAIQIENLSLRRTLREAGGSHLIDINVGGKTRTVLAREIQRHPTRGELYHVDFIEVNLRQPISTMANLVAVGEAGPAAAGKGVAVLAVYNVEIEALPEDLVGEIEVDMSLIQAIDGAIHVRDLSVPSGVTILTDGDMVVARFETVAAEVEEAEEVAEPAAEGIEIIGKGKREEELEE
jgi:large subunit ribosomal protein L25